MRTLPVVVVLFATFLLYARTLSYRFVYDDNYQILGNSHILSWHYLPVYFTQNVWSHVPDTTNFYRPFFLIWLRLNIALLGIDPWGWHLTAVAMNVLVTSLVYLLAYRLLNHRPAALVAAAIFGFHPAHVEAVAWVSGITESLAAGLLLAAFLCYLKQRAHSTKSSFWLILSVILFGAAVLAKETEVVLPFLIILYEFTIGRSSPQPRWGIKLVPYFVVLIAYFGLRALAMHGVLNFHYGDVSRHDILLSLPWLVCVYLQKLVWPAPLAVMYDFPYVDHVASWRFLIGMTVILVCFGCVWWTWKRHLQLGTFLSGWFALTLAPALPAFYLASRAENYHDRYLYVPSFALAMAAAVLFRHLYLRHSVGARDVAWGGVTLLLGAMAFSTYYQQQYWETDEVLFKHGTDIAPQNDRVLANYALQLTKRGDYPRALALSERMMKIHPESIFPVNAAALAAYQSRDFRLAESYYLRAIELAPSVWQMYFRVGACRVNLGQYEDAMEPLRTAARLSSNSEMIHFTLGTALAKLGRWPEARNEFIKELAINRENVPTKNALAETEAHLQAAQDRVVHSRQSSLPADTSN